MLIVYNSALTWFSERRKNFSIYWGEKWEWWPNSKKQVNDVIYRTLHKTTTQDDLRIFKYRAGFPSLSVVKNPLANAGDVGSTPGSWKIQYSCLGNPMDREVWWTAVYGVTKNQVQLYWLSMHASIQHIGSPKSLINRGFWLSLSLMNQCNIL